MSMGEPVSAEGMGPRWVGETSLHPGLQLHAIREYGLRHRGLHLAFEVFMSVMLMLTSDHKQ